MRNSSDFHNWFDAHTHDRCTPNGVVNISLDDDASLFRLFSIGIHPWEVDMQWHQRLADLTHQLEQMSDDDRRRMAAIGEIGLDKLRGVNLTIQQACFAAQLRLAQSLDKPVIIHCVKAVDEVLATLNLVGFSQPVVFHGFRGGPVQARQLLAKGFYLSFGPHFHAESIQAAWKEGRMLLETDDSGIDIQDVYGAVAKVLKMSPTDLSMPGIFVS